MDTKTLLSGLIGFFIGGLLVSVAATTFDKPEADGHAKTDAQARVSLEKLSGNDYDKAFLEHMIVHHQGAVDMARLSAERAGHPELRTFSKLIGEAQQKEIAKMKQWQKDWGFMTKQDHDTSGDHDAKPHGH